MSVKITDRAIRIPPDDVVEAARILVEHFDRDDLTAAIARAAQERGQAIDALTEHAIAEFRSGRTRNLRQLAAGAGVDLDATALSDEE